jgi:hypothetical protein
MVVVGLCLSFAACSGAPSTSTDSLTGGWVRPATFEQVQQAIDDLYRTYPASNTFEARAVSYNLQTREKVLRMCHEGGRAESAEERRVHKVTACAPLIFFFYQFGLDDNVPASIDVARQLYAFAVANNSPEIGGVLMQLLNSWGVT